MPEDIVQRIRQLMANDEQRHQEEMRVLTASTTTAVVRVDAVSRHHKPKLA